MRERSPTCGTRVSIAESITVGGYVRGEEERHGGAISCGKVGGVIQEIATGGNLNLRGGRQQTIGATNKMQPLTLTLVELPAGTVGLAVPAEVVVVAPLAIDSG